MTKNMGGIDRTVRIGLGDLLVSLAAIGQVGAWGWIGLLPLATGTLGGCPPYSLLGISTGKNCNLPE